MAEIELKCPRCGTLKTYKITVLEQVVLKDEIGGWGTVQVKIRFSTENTKCENANYCSIDFPGTKISFLKFNNFLDFPF